jgi:opacity protein-like surface antigen
MIKLLENPEIKKLLEPRKITLDLYDDGKMEHGDSKKGDGIYSAKLTDSNLPGLYSFVFDVEGNTSGGWPIKRIQTHSTIVRVKPDLDKTRKTVRWIKKSADGSGTALITVIPYDKFENYLGPDYGNAIRFSTTYGNQEGDIYDALDGSYEFKLHLPDRTQDPTIDLSVLGFDVYKGPLSKLFQVTERFGVSAHFGIAFPASELNRFYNPDFSWGLDLEFLLSNYLSLEGLFGHHTFKSKKLSDIYWMNFSGNLKFFLNTRRIRPFINGGAGFYKTNDNSKYYFGFNVGGGIAVQIRPTFYIESGYNYHNVRMEEDNILFSTVQLGLRLRF